MKFTRESPASVAVRSVSDEEIRIGDDRWTHSVALSTSGVVGQWAEKPVSELIADDFAALLDDAPEVIVLGTGRSQLLPPRDLVFAMARRSIGLEVMDTRAAARTFNVLAGEDRQVAAVLYID